MSDSRMLKRLIIFPFFLWFIFELGCNSGFSPKPYYIGQEREIASNPERIERMKSEIRKFYGAPYQWGGETPKGTDCSGMVKSIYRNALNINLPHNAQDIFEMSKKIYRMDLQFGDLVFFSSTGGRATHMGIYISNNFFLHASSSRGVILSKLSESYYKKQFIGAGRIEVY